MHGHRPESNDGMANVVVRRPVSCTTVLRRPWNSALLATTLPAESLISMCRLLVWPPVESLSPVKLWNLAVTLRSVPFRDAGTSNVLVAPALPNQQVRMWST